MERPRVTDRLYWDKVSEREPVPIADREGVDGMR